MTREPKPVDWRALAKTLTPRTQAFIDGRYVPAVSGATFDCINPANGQVIAKVASCDARGRRRRGRERAQGLRGRRLVAAGARPRARRCCCASRS